MRSAIMQSLSYDVYHIYVTMENPNVKVCDKTRHLADQGKKYKLVPLNTHQSRTILIVHDLLNVCCSHATF